ncbi:hypothetical protein KEM55_008346 [Ascosphaera atra]|nr:hypothetical protein KEM55_008346 [Ascosphaera atra]
MTFMGNTTDNVTGPNFAGEETPFWATFVLPDSKNESQDQKKVKRANEKSSETDDDGPIISANMTTPNPAVFIPKPAVAGDGTAAPAQLYPAAKNQPLRLYDRGKSTEHYGFYTYYPRTIFLKGLSKSDKDDDPDDHDGGSTKTAAKLQCTWSSTRFLVQIWTKPDENHMTINGEPSDVDKVDGNPFSLSSSAAKDFTRPGSFPYPVTVTIDRHGGVTHDKMVYCYEMDTHQKFMLDQNRTVDEDRGVKGKLVDPAPPLYLSSSNKRDVLDSLIGVGDSIDGGTGGCRCEYRNWKNA